MSDRDRVDHFTERARKVLSLAQEEAQRFNHNYIGTEHVLLGLVREGEGVGAKVLSNLGVDLERVRTQTIQVLAQASGLRSAQPKETASDEATGDGAAASAEVQEALRALQAVIDEKEAAILRQEYELAAELREREVTLRDKIARLEAEGQEKAGDDEAAEDNQE